MNEISQRIMLDFKNLARALSVSKANPGHILEDIVFIFGAILLVIFLASLGKKIVRSLKLEIDQSGELIFSLGLGILLWGTLVLLFGILGIFNFQIIWLTAIGLFIFSLDGFFSCVTDLSQIKVIIPANKFHRKLLLFFFFFIFWNFIGALTPEKGVDAIGYHLYFPKVYLTNGTMMLPAYGSRLFSLFPHLASMIYVLPVSLNQPNIAQLFHFILGILSAINLGLIAQKYFKGNFLPSILFFYSVLIVGSVSRSAYSDFYVTFFLSLAVWAGIIFNQKGGKWWLISGLMMGGALATKNQSLALWPISFLFLYYLLKIRVKSLIRIFVISFFPPFLWYLRSFLVAGNPFYPMFTLNDFRVPLVGENGHSVFWFLELAKGVFLFQPLLAIIFFGLIFNKTLRAKKEPLILVFLVILYWLVLPKSFHDWRYFLPFYWLTIFSFSFLFDKLFKTPFFRFGLIITVFGLMIPRAYSHSLFLPYVFGLESKEVFLSQALGNRVEDFYDIDGNFSKFIKAKDKVLVDKILGLYYLNFPFEEFEYSTFGQKKFTLNQFKKTWGDQNFTYLLLKNESLPDFLDKIGIGREGEGLFSLEFVYLPNKTYLYQQNF